MSKQQRGSRRSPYLSSSISRRDRTDGGSGMKLPTRNSVKNPEEDSSKYSRLTSVAVMNILVPY